jgi:hypothetical protein
MEGVKEGFEYDIDLPPGTFDLPPPGKPVVQPDLERVAQDVTDLLPAVERDEVEEVIARSNSAWTSGDFAAFAASWSFMGARPFNPLPGKEAWRRRLQASGRIEGCWISHTRSITRADFLGVARGTSMFQCVRSPGVLWVAADLAILHRDGTAVWAGEVKYYLARRKGGYRIIHWEYPSEEIAAAAG